MGTTRGQLRSIVRAEALIISLFGALEGLLLGMIFGWAIVAAIAPSRRAARLDILRAVTTE